MKRYESRRALGGLLKTLAAFAFVVSAGQAVAQQGIATTRHNLGTGNTIVGANRVTAGTAEVCVFCHTPHGASRPAGVESPPLWNKRLPSGATYQTYSTTNSSTIQGQVLAVGSISLACLSCHDGTQAMDNIVNAPGSGGFDATGGGTNGLGFTWVTGQRVTPEGLLTGIANLGADLRDDHPIGIQYCGGGITTTASACADPDFRAPATSTINGAQVWWVDSGRDLNGVVTAGAGTREKGDMQLYTRVFPAGTGPAVECGSCHDPHVAPGVTSGAGGRVTGATFLRISNDNSAVCLTCHAK